MIPLFAIACFSIAGVCGAYRLLVGPDLADRIMALDVTVISFMGALTVDAARRGDTTNLIMLVVLAIVGFTATVSATRFLEHETSTQTTPPAITDETSSR